MDTVPYLPREQQLHTRRSLALHLMNGTCLRASAASCLQVVAFIKGTRTQPQCGFSFKVLTLLNEARTDYEVVDVLDEQYNPGVREAIKTYSQWPTIPQVWLVTLQSTELTLYICQTSYVQSPAQRHLHCFFVVEFSATIPLPQLCFLP